MKNRADLQRLAQIARAGLDRDLAALKVAADRREVLVHRLAGLDPAIATTLDPVTAARVAATHQIWADARRADINMALARSTAEWLERQDIAREAFGRWQVLSRLTTRKGASR